VAHSSQAAATPPAAEASRRDEARSLFGEILDWMFAPLLLLWPMSVTLTYLVAQSIASTPYDQALVERGEALAARVRFDAGRARFDLTPALLDIYGNGQGEPGTYVIVDTDGSVLAGDSDLPHGRNDPRTTDGALNGAFQLRDDTLRGHPVRVAYARLAAPLASGAAPAPAPRGRGTPEPADEHTTPAVLVAVAEPPAARTQLANEIVKGVILPQFIVLPLALLLVWFGLTRGLAPLSRLQKTIRDRLPDDLSPIRAEGAPEELTPLLAAFNELLARMTRNLAVQRRFIADAAHQMKTPLAGLRTQAELAQRGGDTQELQRSLGQIAAATDRATRLVNQMLALARAEHDGGAAAMLEAVDLDRLARSVVQDWVATAMAQNIDLGYEGPAADSAAEPQASAGAELGAGPQAGAEGKRGAGRDAGGDAGPDAVTNAGPDGRTAPDDGGTHDCHICGTPGPLREMLNNLIDNALRYTAPVDRDSGGAAGTSAPPGGRHCGVVTVRVLREPKGVLLEVEDTGPGIAPEERAQIFERFYRILGSGQDGSGLGLAIVREIAVQHGAVISVDSAGAGSSAMPGGPGARFRILFPHAKRVADDAARSV
jgi:two-component system sensor histidine kinase TctE